MDTNQLSITTSKQGVLTCKVDEVYLHSQYNPHQEAVRNMESQLSRMKSSYPPKVIIIVGAGLGYELEVLRSKFPQTGIIPIYFNSILYNQNNTDNKILYSLTSDSLLQSLRFYLRKENNILLTLQDIRILYWPPSANIWPQNTAYCLKDINDILLLHFSELQTIKQFISQWIRNACFHYLNIDYWYLPSAPTQKNIVVTAAGPSLNDKIDELKKKRNEYILIAVSSSLSCLFAHRVYPDIIVHQDSSYYSSRYLIGFPADYSPYIAYPLQTSRSNILRNHRSIILNTKQEPENLLQLQSDMLNISAHGTVLGSALELAWQLTQNKVYLAGFDLCVDSSGQHCNPHLSLNVHHHGDRIYSYEQQLLHQFYSTPHELNLKRNNINIRQTIPLKSYSDWFSRWNHPSKQSKTVILSDIQFPHQESLPFESTIPQSRSTQSSLSYRSIQRPPFHTRKKQLLYLTQKWLSLWDVIFLNKKQDTNHPLSIINTLEELSAIIQYDDFIKIVKSINEYTDNTNNN